MSLGERIKEGRQRANLSQTQLANKLGSLSRNAVSLWEANRTRPSTEHLLRLPTILDVDPIWLLADSTSQSVIEVRLLSWVSAGELTDGETIEGWEDLPTVQAADLPAGDWIALKVQGTSMDKIAPDGAVIFVNRRDKTLVAGKDYVFRTTEGTSYKRYRTQDGQGHFEPFSTEETHEPIYPRGQVKIIGRVRRVQVEC